MATETRQRLADAAWWCVTEMGLDGATSRAITAAADANLGAITYHFGSKEALLAEAIGGAIERLVLPALDALADPTVDAGTRVITAVNLLQEADARSAGDAPAYLEVLLQARRWPLVRDRVEGLFTLIRDTLEEQIMDQRLAGSLPAWVDPRAMAGLLLAVAEGVVLQTSVDPGGSEAGAMARQFAQLFMASGGQR